MQYHLAATTLKYEQSKSNKKTVKVKLQSALIAGAI